ncbi:MAG: glucose 1-dehydrogenase [Candidatus Latescibacteria bacterium]|nr:glucose 1-dehydrogenase [Candidatus Latescibacterota bacterium]
MDLGLKDKVALVTGSSRGIGRSIALGLAEEGCNVSLCARGETTLRQTESEVSAKGVRTVATAVDMMQAGGVQQVVQNTLEEFGRIDILINNVGGSKWTPFGDVADEEWNEIFDMNLWAAVRATRSVLPTMKEQGSGVVVTISSIFGRESGGPVTYNATKAAEISMAKTLAKELAPDGIRVNSIAPGSIIFPGGNWQKRLDDDPEGIGNFVKQEIPWGRFGTPEEVANVVVFVASDRASWVTGACINVDGCQSRSLI